MFLSQWIYLFFVNISSKYKSHKNQMTYFMLIRYHRESPSVSIKFLTLWLFLIIYENTFPIVFNKNNEIDFPFHIAKFWNSPLCLGKGTLCSINFYYLKFLSDIKILYHRFAKNRNVSIRTIKCWMLFNFMESFVLEKWWI